MKNLMPLVVAAALGCGVSLSAQDGAVDFEIKIVRVLFLL